MNHLIISLQVEELFIKLGVATVGRGYASSEDMGGGSLWVAASSGDLEINQAKTELGQIKLNKMQKKKKTEQEAERKREKAEKEKDGWRKLRSQ